MRCDFYRIIFKTDLSLLIKLRLADYNYKLRYVSIMSITPRWLLIMNPKSSEFLVLHDEQFNLQILPEQNAPCYMYYMYRATCTAFLDYFEVWSRMVASERNMLTVLFRGKFAYFKIHNGVGWDTAWSTVMDHYGTVIGPWYTVVDLSTVPR